ncbi:CDP-glucose 4,6-dehydratase [Paracoccus aerodenitrificans]|uniref:CDP-glucose 4,6-dehydratase n=1 Tax=Paracoccus aerodenitrificans TaxID=3017781 RepID=UPI0022EFDA98|nr:CDP-glucose 4,6-dehydratase [Paracoccus aerodenitrificans]WBU62710.1 CDP-glucose 4,6-dehydratase [Paracoccus aerodenitrificans]
MFPAEPGKTGNLLSIFAGRRVLLTGHTGFKGGWLTLWLDRLGAKIRGVALPPQTDPALFDIARIAQSCDSRIADINDTEALEEAIADFDPELIIHMAAEAIVRDSYEAPVRTFATNVVGTANVLEMARRAASLRGVIVVTSDKCYENREWDWGYREIDPLGGSDPYSASKACTELVAQAYRRSFFSDPAGPRLVSVRAGNVIGGGDWAPHRLIPDIVRATRSGTETAIRNPASIRPWQHVLEPLSGYLTVAARIMAGTGPDLAGAWNFGPDTDATIPVGELCRKFARIWGEDGPGFCFGISPAGPHEAGLLRLDSTRARLHLGWHPRLELSEALRLTAEWYRAYLRGDSDLRELTLSQIIKYEVRMTFFNEFEPQNRTG